MDGSLQGCVCALLHRRACREDHAAGGGGRLQTSKLVTLLAIFSSCVRIEGVHPLQFGLVRRKSRTQRRYGMPLVNPLIFYPWRAYDFSMAMAKWGLIFWRYYRMMKRIKKNPAAKSYSDEAMRLPVATPTKPTRSSNCSPTRFRTPMARRCAPRSGAKPCDLDTISEAV